MGQRKENNTLVKNKHIATKTASGKGSSGNNGGGGGVRVGG